MALPFQTTLKWATAADFDALADVMFAAVREGESPYTEAQRQAHDYGRGQSQNLGISVAAFARTRDAADVEILRLPPFPARPAFVPRVEIFARRRPAKTQDNAAVGAATAYH